MNEHPYQFKLHAANRMKKRYATVLTNEDRSAILEMIKRDRCVKLYKRDGNYIVAAWYDNQWIALVYNPAQRAIITVLPEEVLEKHHFTLVASPFYQSIENVKPPSSSPTFKSIKISDATSRDLSRHFSLTMRDNGLTIRKGCLEGEKDGFDNLSQRIEFKATMTPPATEEGRAYLDLVLAMEQVMAQVQS
jgi:hypothetical protein